MQYFYINFSCVSQGSVFFKSQKKSLFFLVVQGIYPPPILVVRPITKTTFFMCVFPKTQCKSAHNSKLQSLHARRFNKITFFPFSALLSKDLMFPLKKTKRLTFMLGVSQIQKMFLHRKKKIQKIQGLSNEMWMRV